jgi:hypothetical protein
MTKNEEIKQAIYNMGGPKIAGRTLRVSTSAIGKWIRNGRIPNLDLAQRVSTASGFPLAILRPRYEAVGQRTTDSSCALPLGQGTK